MAEQTQKEFDALRKDMETLRADMNALTDSLHDLLGEKVERAKTSARQAGERVQNQAQQVRDTVSDQVEERPLTALFTAFGIGMVLGALFSRRG